MKELKISKFDDIRGINPSTITVEEMINEMINPSEDLDNQIGVIQYYKNKGDKIKSNKLKSKLPHYVIMGLFNEQKRNTENFDVDSYTGIIPIDIDDIPKEEMNVVFDTLKGIPSVFFVINSASGKGVKALFKSKVGLYDPLRHYDACIQKFYPEIEELLRIPLDIKQGQMTQPFYYTTSTKHYINYDVKEYDLDFELREVKPYVELKPGEYDENFNYIPDWYFTTYSIRCISACNEATNKRQYYDKYKELYTNVDGSLYKHLDTFENFISMVESKSYDRPGNFIPAFVPDEIDINDEIENNKVCVGEVVDNVNFSVVVDDDNVDDEFVNKHKLPTITEFVYDNLPPLMKELTDRYDDKYDKDIILLSQLTVLSGLFDRVSIRYAKKLINPNLFTLIVGKAGIGKGIMTHPMETIKQLLDKEDFENDNKLVEFHKNLTYNKVNAKKANFEPKDVTPPIYHRTKIAPDSSFAALFKQIKDNDGLGVIFDTELDTLSKNNKSEWGDLSILLRKGFQNEGHELQRLTKIDRVDKVKTSLLVSGTNNQLLEYFTSKTDGKMSRHIFYYIDKKFEVMDNLFDDFDYDSYLSVTYGDKLKSLLDKIKDKDISIKVSKEQEKAWFDFLSKKLKNQILLYDDENVGFFVRLGTIGVKIMMILTILRLYDTNDSTAESILFDDLRSSVKINSTYHVSNMDMKIAMNMISKTFVKHSVAIHNSFEVEKETKVTVGPYSDIDLYDDLNKTFTRSEVIILCHDKMNRSSMTADRIIKKLKSNNKIKTVGKKYHKI